MSGAVHRLPVRREEPPLAPSPTPQLPRIIASALKDNVYRSEPWSAHETYRYLVSSAADPDIRRCAMQHRASLQPADRHWLKKRLSTMALAFGHERDPDRATAWLAETGRLLMDIPGDILAHAIDEAIKRSARGFMPAVGEIRAIADPLVVERERETRRLEALVAAMAGGARQSEAAPFDPADRCTPEEAAAILQEFGLPSAQPKPATTHLGPLRNPTTQDYIDLMGAAAWSAVQAGRGQPSNEAE